MSYDLAVWEGVRPDGDEEAGAVFGGLAERYLEGEEIPATPGITRFVEALVRRWGDLDGTGDSPWASGGTGDASGPVLHVTIRYGDERAGEVSAYVAELAHEHGLVCYDFQQGRLRP